MLFGTYWRTNWELHENQKISKKSNTLPHRPLPQKGEKTGSIEWMLQLCIDRQEIIFPSVFMAYFGVGYLQGQDLWGRSLILNVLVLGLKPSFIAVPRRGDVELGIISGLPHACNSLDSSQHCFMLATPSTHPATPSTHPSTPSSLHLQVML